MKVNARGPPLALTICLAFVLAIVITGERWDIFPYRPAPTSKGTVRRARHKTVLLYVTTHLSESHMTFLQLCWPGLLANSSLYRNADVTMLVTKNHRSHINMTFLNRLFRTSNFRVHVRPNPGYQEGAILGLNEAHASGWFDGYDWVIRVNPDVLIRNDTSIMKRLHDPNIDGVFVDCNDSHCMPGPNCTKRRYVHTDFIAFRPEVIGRYAFKHSVHQNHAESQATDVFSAIINNRKDSWLSEAGPMGNDCRVRGVNSPVLHVHELDKIYPSCLSWYGD